MKTYKTNTKRFSIKANDSTFPKAQINSSKDSAEFIRQFYSDDIEIYESFYLLLLNNANNTIGYVKISQGGVVGTVVDYAIIAKYAIESLARGVIIAHNHPSGSLTPSNQDNKLTAKIRQGLQLFDITLLDHVILSKNGYYSYADEGNSALN